jgi:ABC-type branched-subunit amino acid transport system substrate-binding protein
LPKFATKPTKKVINAKGLNETLYEGINPGEKDFSALVSKLKQSGIDLVYWGGLHTEAGLIIRQMRDQASTRSSWDLMALCRPSSRRLPVPEQKERS